MSSLVSYNGLSVLTPEPSADGGKAINENFKALSTALETTDPGSSNDDTEYYSAGSRWINTTTGIEWLCTSSATGAALWVALIPTLDEVTTSGGTTANTVQVGSLAVTGSSSLDGGAITSDGSGNLSVDGLNENTIAVNSFVWTTDNTQPHYYHLGAGAGTSPAGEVNGGETGALISLNTGTSPTSSTIISLNMTNYGNSYIVVLTPGNAAAAALTGSQQVWVNSSGTHWNIAAGSTPLAASTNYRWYFIAIGQN
jgi:hypothetical protein